MLYDEYRTSTVRHKVATTRNNGAVPVRYGHRDAAGRYCAITVLVRVLVRVRVRVLLCEDFNWAVRQSSAAQNLKPNASFIFFCEG